MHGKALSLPAIVLFLLLCGCCAPASCGEKVPDVGTELVCFDGQVTFVPLEGGFYGITSFDGEKYDPVELPEAFRHDGLRVRIKARLVPRSIGVHMWGKKIEIIAIEKL
jgi:hypothetical protein